MGTTLKGIYKGIKYTLSQMFVVKECEVEIGYPTDVKHVAHVGCDDSTGSAPGWMNQFQTRPDFTMSIGNSGSVLSLLSSSQDFDEPKQQPGQSGSKMCRDVPPLDLTLLDQKRMSTSSLTATSGASSCSPNAAMLKTGGKSNRVVSHMKS